jgi:hypothetical protein
MIRPSLRRIAVLALCLVLAGSAALSAKPRATVSPDSVAVSRGGPVSLWDTVWSLLVKVWTKNGGAGDPYGVGAKNGSASDPDGKPPASSPDGDNGCAGDPDGGR